MSVKENSRLLTKPSSLTIKDVYQNVNRSIISVEPFERGFGYTIGNALRRVLLSSIGGYAVTAIRIEGVLHEYARIDGVVEDVQDIIMNVKSLAIVKDGSSSVTLKLSAHSAGPVHAASIECPAGVNILNKDLVICNLSKGGKIDMVLHVDYGKGYIMPDSQNSAEHVTGTLAIGAIFNPIKRVAYHVENARVGQVTDYDKLILEIDTNGSISGRDAVGVAAKLLQDQLAGFINFDLSEDEREEKRDSSEPDFNRNLLKTIDELELSVRSYNCLKNENIVYVGDLVKRTEGEMLRTANFGRKSLNELKENLKSMGLSFGMKLVNWPPKNLEELLKQKNKEF